MPTSAGDRLGHDQRSRGGEALAIDAAGRPWQGLEALGGDLGAASKACSVGPRVEPVEGLVDQHQLVVGPVAQRQVALLRKDLAGRGGLRAVGHLLGRDDRLLALPEDAGALRLEGRTGGLGIDGRHGSMVVDAILHGSTPKEGVVAIEIDPVCGMEVDTSTSLLSFEYEGRTYWFCGRGCLLDFKDDPAAFLPAEDPQPA